MICSDRATGHLEHKLEKLLRVINDKLEDIKMRDRKLRQLLKGTMSRWDTGAGPEMYHGWKVNMQSMLQYGGVF